MTENIDAELEAIKRLQETLRPLTPEVRTRVLEYVFKVLGIEAHPEASMAPNAAASLELASAPVFSPAMSTRPQAVHKDILSLKLEKQPTSATQMVALIAYYLAHEAPDHERKAAIGTEDVKNYFVQARYPLPSSPGMALAHARNAGFLNPVDRGTYCLNSVGYNLVAHKMGVGDGASIPTSRNGKRKQKKVSKR